MTAKKTKDKARVKKAAEPEKKEGEKAEELSERTVLTKIQKVEVPEEQKAYIMFISGQLAGKLCYLENRETVIGRAPECDISINDTRISRQHLRISLSGDQAVIEDLESTNGTFVNGERIKRRALANGDQIHISSDTIFKFALGSEAEQILLKEMHQMANYDAVTGIYNKHVFEKRLSEEFSFAKRNSIPLAMLMIDIDHFKLVNDNHGHIAGDYVLQGVAQRIQRALRGEDILARYGGEEFAVIMRGTEIRGAAIIAERVRQLVADTPMKFEKELIPVTISIGVAALAGANYEKPRQLIAQADACLYQSKETGRNRVTS
ncbi:MAG: GGDEF domain-containing protein [Proteobacteria bacterium]|nr:GGDEF domain-containing protein [Pseudomonadota bacterium]